ncbi:MAG: chorismate-binding protein [Polyangiaceae bacterium]
MARALLTAGFPDYVAWSDGERHSVVAGARARVVLDGKTFTVRDASNNVTAEVTTTEPFGDAGRLLREAVRGPFRAWGYLGFALTSFKYPYTKSLGPALHLIVPEITCHLEGGIVTFEGDDGAVARARAALSNLPASEGPRGRSGAAAAVDAVETGRSVYEAGVKEVLAAIRERKVEKVILARQVVLAGKLDPLATLTASSQTPAARRFAFTLGEVTGVGACPEFLIMGDAERHVITNPLAGTQPRGATEEEDARLTANLLRDVKEVSEHAMSIRLAYDEIASVCTAETARVVDFMRVKRYAFTQHLSSRAAGTLAPGLTTWDALRAVFPGVTVSGIAKHEAIAMLDRLEPTPRGVYGGAVGWVDHTGAMDWGIAIRSSFDYGQGVTLNAGAGIVIDSDPAYEFDESAHKMRTMGSRIVLE